MTSISWADRERSRLRAALLGDIARDVDALALPIAMPVTWLAGDGPRDTTAQSLTEFGMLVVNDCHMNPLTRDESEPRLLDEIPREILVAIGVHEYVHLRLGGAFRHLLDRTMPDANRLLVDRIVPDWIAGRIRIERYEEYFTYKGASGEDVSGSTCGLRG